MPSEENLMKIVLESDLLSISFAEYFTSLRSMKLDGKRTKIDLYALAYKNEYLAQPEDHEISDNFLIFGLAKEFYGKMV